MRNIELGTFTWDSSKLTDQVAANYLQLSKLKEEVKLNAEAVKVLQGIIEKSEKAIEKERRAQERLTDGFSRGQMTLQQYTLAISNSNNVIERYIGEQQEAVRRQAELALEITHTQREISELNTEQRELNRLLAAGREEVTESEGAYKRLTRELSAAQTEAKNLGAQLIEMDRSGIKESDPEAYALLAAKFAEASARAKELNDQILEVDHSVGDNRRNVGNYQEAIVSAFSEITEGLIQMSGGNVSDGFEQVQNGLSGITDNAKMLYATLLANPMTAILVGIAAIVTGIGLGVKEIFDYNNSIAENYKLTNNLFNNLGDKTQKYLDEVRNNMTGIAKTFDVEFSTLADTVDKLLDAGAVKDEFEALEIIKNGLLSAPDKDEFITKLEAAAEKSKQTGLHIQEVINLNKALEDSPVDAEAVYGALDKATKNLTEQSDKTRDALSSSLGSAFTGDLLHRIDTGKTTVTQALVEISKQSDKMGLSVSESANLGAALFGKSAVAAGGLQNVLLMVNKAYEEQTAELTPLQKVTEELTQAHIELAREKDKALKSDSILVFQKNLEVFWVKAQTIWYGFVDAVTDVITWYDNLTGSSEVLGEVWDAVSEYAESLWKLIEDMVDVFSNLAAALGLNNSESQSYIKTMLKTINPLQMLKGLYQGLTAGIKIFSGIVQSAGINLSTFGITAKSIFRQISDAAQSFMNLDFEGGLQKLKNINLSKEFTDARKEAERIFTLNKASKNKEDTQKADPGEEKPKPKNPKPAEPEKPKKEPKTKAERKVDDTEKKLQEEAKRAIEIARETAEQKTEIAKTELAEYILNNAEKYKNDQTLLQHKLKAQLAYFDEVRKLQQQANNAEEAAKIFAIEQKIAEIEKKKELGKQLSENDLNEIKNLTTERQNIHKEYYRKEIDLTKATEEQKEKIQEDYDLKVAEQKKLRQAIEFQQRILDLQTQGASEFEIQKAQEEERFQKELADWAEQNKIKMDLDNDQDISKQEIQATRDELQNQYNVAKGEDEKMRIKNQLDAIDFMVAQSAERQKQIDKAAQDAKYQGYANLFEGISKLLGENTKAGKTAALAQVAISQGLAIARIWEQTSILPSPFGVIQKVVETGIAVGNVIKAAQQINSVKAAKGMMINGPSHANGGVPIMTPSGMIEAEGGEIIINKKSSALFANELSAINQAGGGVAFANGGVIGSNLATVQNSIKTINPVITLDSNAVNEIKEAIYSGSQDGFSDLSQNRKIANASNF